jgi:hypothetical protein
MDFSLPDVFANDLTNIKSLPASADSLTDLIVAEKENDGDVSKVDFNDFLTEI